MFLKIIKFLLFIIIVSLLAYAGWTVWQKQLQATASSQTTSLYRVHRGNILNKATAPGTIYPYLETAIAAPYRGYIKKIYVHTGQIVKKNAPLVTVVQALQSNERVYPIRAPFTGIVVLVNKKEGDYVSGGGASTNFIVKISDLSRLFVKASVAERDISKIKKGQKVLIKPSSVTGKLYKGIVETVALAPTPQRTRSSSKQTVFPVTIKVLHPDAHLYSGMSVINDIIVNNKKDVIIVPHEYLRHKGSGYYVVLADNAKRFVKIGIQTPRYVEITKGLTGGEELKKIDYFRL